MINIDFISLAYLAFRLAPFLLVSYFCLSSLFNNDTKALFYLAGLLISCFTCVLVGKSSDSWFATPADRNESCHTFTLSPDTAFSNIPLGTNTLFYTFAYLAYTMKFFSNPGQTAPTIVFLCLLIGGDIIWQMTKACVNNVSWFVAFILGVLIGWAWALLMNQSGYVVANPSNSEVCSQPSKQLFKCKNMNIRKLGGDKKGGDGKVNSWENWNQQVSSLLYQEPQTIYGGNTQNFALPYVGGGGVYWIIVDGSENQNSNGVLVTTIAGVLNGARSNTTTVGVLPGFENCPLSVTGVANGKFNVVSTTPDYSTAMISYLPIYDKKEKKVLSTMNGKAVNMNLGSGGQPYTMTFPESGVYCVVVDGGALADASQLYCFWVAVSLDDSTNVSWTQQTGLPTNMGLTLTGKIGGSVICAIQSSNQSATNFYAYTSTLYNSATTALQTQSFNCNTGAGGSATHFVLPTSGAFIITVDGNQLKDLTAMTTFLVVGCKEGNSVSVVSQIYNPGSFVIVGLANGQFNVSMEGGTNTQTNFLIYYSKIYK